LIKKNLISPEFEHALTDYYYLLNREYTEKESLKLVGDRYRLSGVERNVLFRGIAPANTNLTVKAKILHFTRLGDKKLFIDGYNVLFTIMNYLLGKLVFLSSDGLLRDSGEIYGRIEKEDIFGKSQDLLIRFLGQGHVKDVTLYLDSPVTNSLEHKKEIEKKIISLLPKINVSLVRSVDKVLKNIPGSVIATSDSEIIAQSPCRVLDLPRVVLETFFSVSFLDLRELVKSR